MADRSPTWRFIAATVAIAALGSGAARAADTFTALSKSLPQPSTPTSKRAKVKAARKQRQRNG